MIIFLQYPHTGGFLSLPFSWQHHMWRDWKAEGNTKMYAIIKTGGKQYRVAEGDIINVEKLEVAVDETIALEDVLFVNDGETTYVGKPVVEGAKVEAKVLAEGKSEKVIVFKYKAKKDYRKKQGHRQPYTQLQITKIAVK